MAFSYNTQVWLARPYQCHPFTADSATIRLSHGAAQNVRIPSIQDRHSRASEKLPASSAKLNLVH